MSCLLASHRIAVDPGHGGSDPGAVAGGVREKDVTMRYADALAKELQRRGHRPLLTRHTDEDVSLYARAELANTADVTAFVSVHANASAGDVARGSWVLHHHASSKGRALASEIADRLACLPGVARAHAYPDKSGYSSWRSLAVLRETRMPAVLVELGFLTNAEDRRLLAKVDTPALMARAIADGLEDWIRSLYPPPPPSSGDAA